jgi:hypothetical protein
VKPAGASCARATPLADIASDVEQVGGVAQLPQVIFDETAVRVRNPRAASPGSIDAQERQQHGLGRVEPYVGLAVVLEASEGVEEQQGLVRGSPAAAGELADAVESGEQGLAGERYRGRWRIERWLRHRAAAVYPPRFAVRVSLRLCRLAGAQP